MKDLYKSGNIVNSLDELEMLSRELFVNKNEKTYLRELSQKLDKLSINKTEMQWLQVLSEGWAYPLRGFMREDEYLQTLHFNSITRNGKTRQDYGRNSFFVRIS